MKSEGYHYETHREHSVALPAVESLCAPETTHSPWPSEIAENPERIRQALARREVSDALSTLYEAILSATENITIALENGSVTEDVVIRLYESCATLFESDPLNNRLALYFPFEFLPSSKDSFSPSSELQVAQKRFTMAYRTAWESLLSVHELREDYIEGNIIEVEHRTGPLPEVVKAAHLVPMLVSHGIITLEEAISVSEETSDPVLKQSMDEGLQVVRRADYLSSGQPLQTGPNEIQDASILLREAASAIKDTERSVRSDDSLTEGRKAWMLQKQYNQLAESYGNRLSVLLNGGLLTPDRLQELAKETPAAAQVVMQAVRISLESQARTSKEDARDNFIQYEPLLSALRNEGNVDMEKEYARTLYHLHSLRILTDSELESRGLPLPLLDAPGAEVAMSLREEISAFTKIAKRMKAHPELSRLTYPIVVICGSRVKGYAADDADYDSVIFIRAGVPEEKRSTIQSHLSEIFLGTNSDGKAMEFWLKKEGESLHIQDYDNPDTRRGDSTITHPLLGIWCGDETAISELYRTLMPEYLYSKGKKILGEDARAVWLQEIERDLLKYRLLHKGYGRFNATQNSIAQPGTEPIDGSSTFYDSGYRRLATKLFVDKVFLPQLSP